MYSFNFRYKTSLGEPSLFYLDIKFSRENKPLTRFYGVFDHFYEVMKL